METVDTRSTDDRVILDLREISPGNLLVLGHYNYRKVKKELEVHKHENMIEICFLEKGTQHYGIESSHYILKGGDLLITKPSLSHGTYGFPEEKGSLYWMIIELPGNNQKFLNLSMEESQYLFQRILSLPTPHFRGTVSLKTVLEKIFMAYKKKDNPLKKIEIVNHVLEFLLKVIHFGEKRGRGEVSEAIQKICRHIDEHIMDLLRLEDLADMANLSESRFKHRFKEEVGTPPAEYILRKKIEHSQEMLRTTELSVQHIAYDLNFSSSSYFATVFKRFVGKSPMEFRRL
jgi:AraC-like DNA-binding protein